MDINELARLLDDVTAGRRGAEALQEAASRMSSDDLVQALAHVASLAPQADEHRDVATLTRLLADLLVRWAAVSTEPEALAAAHAAQALYRTELDDPGAAEVAGHLDAVLSLDPEGLARLLESGLLAPEARVRALEVVVALGDESLRSRFQPELDAEHERVRGEARRAESGMRLERARALLGDGGAADEALALVEAHLEEVGDDLEGLMALAQVLLATEGPDTARRRVAERIAAQPADLRPSMLAGLGNVLLPESPEDALALFDQAMAAEISREAVAGMLAAYGALSRGDEAIALLERLRGEVTGRPAELMVLPVLAHAYEAAGRSIDTERTWRRVRAIDPRNLEALAFYEGYLRERGDDQKLFTTLQFALSVVETDAERIRIAREMAVLAEERMHNLDRAVEAWRRVMLIDPTDAQAETALIALYEKTGKWSALVEFYNDRIRRLPADAADQKVATLFQLIAIYQDPDRLPNPDNVLATYARIVEVSPTHEEALETLARGYTDRERWPDLLKVLQKKVLVTQDPGELLELFQQIAEIAITRMSNETQAIPFLERVLELDPENLDVVRKLKRIYDHKHNQERLFAMHLRELEMLEGPARESVMLAAAALARDRLLRHDEALRLYETVYRENSGLREARENLHLLYSRLERWADYAKFLIEEIERPMPPKRRIELMQKLGEIRMDRLADPVGARDVFEEVLVEEPGDDIAARRLESLYLDTGDLASLLRVYRARNDVRSFVALLAQREARETDVEARVAINLSMAKVCREDLDDVPRALRCLDQAFSLDPGLRDVGRELLDAYVADGNRTRAVEILRELALGAPTEDERLALWTRRRDLLEELGRPGEAMLAGLEMLRLGKGDAADRDTLDRMRAGAVVGGLWQDFAAVLEEVASATKDAEWRRDLLLEQGHVYEDRLLFHDEARQALNRVLDLDPGCTEALDLLERISLQQEDFVEMEVVLRRRAAVAVGGEELREIRLRLGRLYEDLLGDDVAATGCYQEMVEADASDREALAGLHRTLDRSERYPELAEVVASEIACSRNAREANRLRCELAEIRSTRLDDDAGAVEVLREVLVEDPANAEAVRQLNRLFESGQAREAAANVLAPHYRSQEQFDALYGLLEARLPDLELPEARAALLLQMADIREVVQEDPDGAFGLVAGAVALHPTDAWAQRLVSLADSTGRHEDAARVLARWVGVAAEGAGRVEGGGLADPEIEARLATQLGRLYGDRLGQPRLAIQSYEKALPFSDEEEALRIALLGLYQEVDDHDAVLATLEQLADMADEDSKRRELRHRRAGFARAIGRKQVAIDTLRGMVDFQADAEAELELEALYRETERFEDLVALLEVQAERSAGEPRIDSMVRRVHVLLDSLAAPDRAAGVLRQALADAPHREDVRTIAEELVFLTEGPRDSECVAGLVASLEAALRRDPAARERLAAVLVVRADLSQGMDAFQALSEAAGIQAESGRQGEAFANLLRALRIQPDDSSVLDRAIQAAEASGASAELADALEALADEAPHDESRIRILLAVARTVRGALEDYPRAVAIYDRLLEMSPGSVDVMREMDALLKIQGRDAERVPLLTEMAATASGLDEKRLIRLEIGELCRRTGDFGGACSAYEWVLERRPAEEALDEPAVEAAQALLELYDAGERADDAVALRRLLADVTSDVGAARDLLLTAAVSLAGRDPAEALVLVERLLEADPMDSEAISLGRSIADATGDRELALRLLTMELACPLDDSDRLRVLAGRAQLRMDLGDVEGALRDVASLVEADPENVVAIAVGERLLEDPSVGGRAAVLLEGSAASAGQADLRIQALHAMVRFVQDDEERARVQGRLGAALVAQDRIDEAVEPLGRAFVVLGEDPAAFDALFEALELAERLDELESLTREAAESRPSEEARASVYLRSGVALVRGGRLDEAARVLEEGAAVAPDNLPILETLVNVYQSAERPRDVIGALLRMSSLVLAGNRVELLHRCGLIARDELGDAEAARRHLEEASAADPLHAGVAQALGTLLGELQDYGALRTLRERQIEALAVRGDAGDAGQVAQLRRDVLSAAVLSGDAEPAVAAALALMEAVEPTPADLDACTDVYERFGAPPTLYRALAEALDLAEEAKRLVELHRKAASMELADPTPDQALAAALRASEALGDVDVQLGLAIDLVRRTPEDAAAQRRLADVARGNGRVQEALALLDAAIEASSDEAVVFEMARLGATLARDDAADPERAAGYLLRATRARPLDESTRDALVAAYSALGRHRDVAQLFEARGDAEVEPSVRCALYFEGVAGLEGVEGEDALRERLLTKVLELDPGNLRAIEMLEARARAAGDSAGVARWLSVRVERMEPIEARRPLITELAEIQERSCNDRNAAIATLDRWLAEDGVFDAGWRRLEGLLLRTRRYDDLARMYEREAEAVGERELKVAALKKAASIHESYLKDPASAGALLHRILDVDPGNAFAFTRLTETLETTGDSAGLAALLQERLPGLTDPADRVALLVRLGGLLHDGVGDVAGAVGHFGEALGLDPHSQRAREGLNRLLDVPEVFHEVSRILHDAFEAAGDASSLRGLLARSLELSEDLDDQVRLLSELAQVEHSRLHDPAAAFDTLSRLLTLDPGNAEVLDRLESAAADAQRFEDLYRLLASTAPDARDAGVRSRLHLAAARIAESRLDVPARAVDHYAAHLRDNPDDGEVLERLERLYAELNRPEDQVRVLRARIAVAGDDASPELRLDLADLLTGEFADPVAALDQVRLALDAGADPARALSLLRRLADSPVVGQEALERMVRVAQEAGDPEAVLWAGSRAIASAGDATDIASLHDLMASTSQQLGLRDQVVKHLGAALVLVPSDEGLLARLLAAGRDPEFAQAGFDALRAAAAAASWPELEKSLLWQAFQLGRTAGVAAESIEACLVRILQIDPASRDALVAADRLYTEQGRKDRLVAVLEQLSRVDLSVKERREVLRRLADLHSESSSPEQAASVIEEAASLSPDNVDLLRKLAGLRKEQGDHAGHADALLRLAGVVGDSEERQLLLLDAARIQENKLGDLHAARASLEKLRREDPDNGAALLRLERIYEKLGDYELLARMLTAVVDGEGPVEERVQAAMRIVSMYEAHLDNVPAAVAMARRAFELDPRNPGTVDELIRLYYQAEDWSGLVSALQHKAAISAAQGERVALLRRAADIADSRLGDIARAGEIAAKIHEFDASDTHALLFTARWLESQGRTGEALIKFRALVNAAGDSDDGIEAQVGLARLGLAVGDTGKDVSDALKAVLAARPDHVEAARLFRRLLAESGDHAGLVQWLQRELKQATDDGERATLCFEIADLYLNRLDDGAKFLEWAEEAYRFKSDNPRVVAGIVNYHLRAGDRVRAIPYLEWLVNYLEGKRRLRELPPYAHELGRALEANGNFDKAIQYYRLCHEHDAANVLNAMALARLFMQRDEHDKALRVYQPLILRMDGLKAADRIEVLLALARIHVARDDRRKARQFVMRVLAEEPDNPEAQAMLERGL